MSIQVVLHRDILYFFSLQWNQSQQGYFFYHVASKAIIFLVIYVQVGVGQIHQISTSASSTFCK